MNNYFELKALATLVKNQLVNNCPIDRQELCSVVEAKFPEFIYEGVAFRYRYDAKRLYQPVAYKSYSKSLAGVETFLDNEKFGQKLQENSKLELIHAEIKGVDLVSLTKFLVKERFLKAQDVEIFQSEDEVISLEIKSFKSVSV